MTTTQTCKHCILRHKKSHSIINVFIGNLIHYCPQISATPFRILYSLYEASEMSKQNDTGIQINLNHSLIEKGSQISQSLLLLPFLSVTNDTGFFKDNLIIHCAESEKMNLVSTENINRGDTSSHMRIMPLLRTSSKFIQDLDTNFWRYFRDLEKFLKINKDCLGEAVFQRQVNKDCSPSLRSSLNNSSGIFLKGKRQESEIKEEPRMYILVTRKKVLKKGLTKYFGVSESSNRAKDFLFVNIKEINFSFHSFQSFSIFKRVRNINYDNAYILYRLLVLLVQYIPGLIST